ncbi:Gram-negative bacterial tonB protein [compost metagenome]
MYSDGSVNNLSILYSDHPDLAEASSKAIEQWRFKPWTVEGDKPSEQEVTAPLVFRLDHDTPIHANLWLKQLRCRDLNETLVDFPEYAWVDAAVFDYTRAYLSNVFNATQLQNEQRLALIAALNKRVPRIVRECRASPVRKYMSLLPEDMRKLF